MTTMTEPTLTSQVLKDYMKSKGMNIEATKFPIPNLKNAWKDVDGNLVIPKSDINTGEFTVNNAETGDIFQAGVKENYRIIQYDMAFQKMLDISKATDISMVDGGVWAGGAEAFIQFDLPGTLKVGSSEDQINKRLLAITSHNSKYAFNIIMTPHRLLCKNQINSIRKKARKSNNLIYLRHNSADFNKLMDIEHWLKVTNEKFQILEEEYNGLLNMKIQDPEMITKILAKIFTVKKDSKKSKTITNSLVTNVMDRYLEADGIPENRDTAWNLYNAIQGTYQHNPSRKTSNHQRSLLVGSIESKSMTALNTIVEVMENYNTVEVDEDIERLLSSIVKSKV